MSTLTSSASVFNPGNVQQPSSSNALTTNSSEMSTSKVTEDSCAAPPNSAYMLLDHPSIMYYAQQAASTTSIQKQIGPESTPAKWMALTPLLVDTASYQLQQQYQQPAPSSYEMSGLQQAQHQTAFELYDSNRADNSKYMSEQSAAKYQILQSGYGDSSAQQEFVCPDRSMILQRTNFGGGPDDFNQSSQNIVSADPAVAAAAYLSSFQQVLSNPTNQVEAVNQLSNTSDRPGVYPSTNQSHSSLSYSQFPNSFSQLLPYAASSTYQSQPYFRGSVFSQSTVSNSGPGDGSLYSGIRPVVNEKKRSISIQGSNSSPSNTIQKDPVSKVKSSRPSNRSNHHGSKRKQQKLSSSTQQRNSEESETDAVSMTNRSMAEVATAGSPAENDIADVSAMSSGVPAPPSQESMVDRVFIWNLDEAVIIFHSLLTGSFAQRFFKDASACLQLGLRIEEIIFSLADTHLFFNNLEECDQVHIDDANSDDNMQDLSHYDFNADGFAPSRQQQQQQPFTDGTNTSQRSSAVVNGVAVSQAAVMLGNASRVASRGNVTVTADWTRKLAFRYRRIKEIYRAHQPDATSLLHEAQRSQWVQLKKELDTITESWSSLALKALQKINSRAPVISQAPTGVNSPSSINVLVTTNHLVPTIAKLLLYGLGNVFDIDNIYCATKVGKEACFQRIAARYGKRATYIVVGDGRDEENVAKLLSWPFWRISSHSDLAALTHAVELGYL